MFLGVTILYTPVFSISSANERRFTFVTILSTNLDCEYIDIIIFSLKSNTRQFNKQDQLLSMPSCARTCLSVPSAHTILSAFGKMLRSIPYICFILVFYNFNPYAAFKKLFRKIKRYSSAADYNYGFNLECL